jgi:hypothetical protein
MKGKAMARAVTPQLPRHPAARKRHLPVVASSAAGNRNHQCRVRVHLENPGLLQISRQPQMVLFPRFLVSD